MKPRLVVLVILSGILLSVVALLPTITAPSIVNTVSYNTGAASRFHAQLSTMGGDGVQEALQSGKLPSPLVGTWKGAVQSTGFATDPSTALPNNTIRFINDGSYMPQTETTVAVDPNNSNHVVGGVNDPRVFYCRVLPASDCPSGWTFSLSAFMVSIDGGKSVLKTNDLPGLLVTEFNATARHHRGNVTGFLVSWGDPSMAVSPTDGQIFYSTLAIDPVTGANAIEIAKSNSSLWDPSNPCVTSQATPSVNSCWTNRLVFGNLTVGAVSFEDKELIAVDNNASSPYYGSVYDAWDHFFANGTSSSYVARCTNDLKTCAMVSGGGQPVASGSDSFVAFSTPVVGKSGNVYLTWCNFGTATTYGPVACRIASSPPGGQTWSRPTDVFSFMGAGTMFPSYNATIGFATEQFRTANIPTLSVDTGSRSPWSGSLYWAIQVCTSRGYYEGATFPTVYGVTASPDNPGNCGTSSIAFTKSTDGGATWSTPTWFEPPQTSNGLNLGSVNDQPFVSVDPSNGNVFVNYYSTRYDTFNHRIDVVSQKSSNGGSSFSPIRITSVSNEPNSDPRMYKYPPIVLNGNGGSIGVPQYGDYFQAVALNGRLYVLYTGNYAQEEGAFQADPFLTVMQV